MQWGDAISEIDSGCGRTSRHAFGAYAWVGGELCCTVCAASLYSLPGLTIR